MENHISPLEVKGYLWVGHPQPYGQGALKTESRVSTAQMVHFCENFIRQKLQDNHEMVG